MNEKNGNTISKSTPGLTWLATLFAIVLLLLTAASTTNAQVSQEEHAQHHPGQTGDAKGGPGMGGPPEGAGPQNGMGGGMGGMMDGMMEKMGAPKPKDLYPSLMELPDLPIERRGELEQEAHGRMIAGTRLLGEGFEELSRSAAGDDFAAMQSATAKIREGLSDFESGLAAHRALREGKAPRDVALQWFKRELNIDDSVNVARSQALLWGMSPFHASVMVVLIAFAVAMIWMYFFKMRRAASLLEKLSTPNAIAEGVGVQSGSGRAAPSTESASSVETTPKQTATQLSEPADCCATDDGCPTEAPADGIDSSGLIPVARKNLCRLRVAKIVQETEDVKTIRLVACHGGRIPFNYLPGQFLTFTLPVGEKPIRRSYTISSAPTLAYYCEVTVKREDKGAGSRYLCDELKVGDTLEVKAPSGRFTFTGEESDRVVLIAGGVGITPMMSVTRALTDMCWPGEIHFIVACRDPEHFIFESEIKWLEERYDNLHVHVAMSRIDQEINGYRKGRLTKELLAEWVPNIASHRVHICGAPAMMDATKAMLSKLGVPVENIHTENFGSTQKPKAKVAKGQEAHEPKATGAKITFAKSDKSTELLADETLLEAAERVGVDIDYSCRVGTCGICLAKLLSGDVRMEVDDGLEPEDRKAGMILCCQAKAKQDVSIEA
ncbi:2Fe-2S iron-sulfur cluster-binding protein [Botrimarina mediterranea]|uniref:2Fe-2S iron-sulfur cluster-binding protein n=1 Tax=Botrimarina mediterranea TaxID=2528022 RepID=UPI0011885A19|nr:3-ketosteroid-9-alpha-hydroxylase reductase subunit [Planctomycetes bacterium K2D]